MSFCKSLWLIDDDVIANFLNESIIQLNDFAKEVLTFTTIDHALSSLEKVAHNKDLFPDFILLDINMPGLDGWDFLDAYQQVAKEVKENCQLYMLSSSIDNQEIDRVKRSDEVMEFISKPLSKEDLELIKAKQKGSIEA